MKKLLSILVFVACLAVTANVARAVDEPVGCCQKTNVNDPSAKPTTIQSTEGQCNAVKTETNGALVGKFFRNANAIADTCQPKNGTQTGSTLDPVVFQPSVSIPGSGYTAGAEVKVENSTTALINYIIAIVKYATGIIGILAAVAMMVGGILWLTAGGNHEQVSTAKKTISSSLVGMGIAFCAFLILSAINTNLVSFKAAPIKPIQQIAIDAAQELPGCCEKQNQDGTTNAQEMMEAECKALTGYKTVTFYKANERQAENNKCVRPGCCQVIDPPGPFPWHYETMTKGECAAINDPARPNRNWTLTPDRANWSFDEKVVASPDQRSCETNRDTACVPVWQWGCTDNSSCCSGTCVRGYETGGGASGRCEPCVGIYKWGCSSTTNPLSQQTTTDCCASTPQQPLILACVQEEGQPLKKCVPSVYQNP